MLDKGTLRDTVWVAVVEENNDPLHRGRIRARVHYIHGDIPTEDLPWMHPGKDNRGTDFKLPTKGKIVNVQFLDGDLGSGIYVGAEHYDVNLQNMLETMDEESYLYFVSMYYDHATQMYRDKEKGFLIDHEYTNINLDQEGCMSLNLRDNKAILALGTADADQAAVLGDHYMDWMDKLMNCLLQGGFIGNLGAPTIANPQLINVITEYKASRDPKFLSRHVFVVDNNAVKTQKRDYVNQQGDKFAENDKIIEPEVHETPYEPDEDVYAPEGTMTAEQQDDLAAEADETSDDAIATDEEPAPGEAKPKKKPKSTGPIGKAVRLTVEILKRYLPNSSAAKRAKYVEPLNKCMQRYQINTPLRQAHFLAQVAHESQDLQYEKEIASGREYEGRKDLGNTQPGDGVRFKGRGLIQLTGRGNYKDYARFSGVDVVSHPELIENDPVLNADVAGWFWAGRKLNRFADQDNVVIVTKRINGGSNGLSERRQYLAHIKQVQESLASNTA